jgi:hypothetical protein
MQSRQKKILSDLLNIYLKHDADEITAAFESLKSGDAFRRFVELGREASKLPGSDLGKSLNKRASSANKRVHPSKRASLDEFISTLLASNEKEHREIAATLKAARDRTILSSTSMLEKLFLTIGLPVPNRADRFSLIHTLGEHLLKLEPDKIEPILQLAKETGKKESSLQRWTNIIVQKGKAD